VLPLDDRFGPRFAENAARSHHRRQFIFHAGVGHIPTEGAPDVRGRSYLIEAHVAIQANDHGVLIAHGDATSGYSFFVDNSRLVHDLNIGGEHQIVRSEQTIAPGDHVLGLYMSQRGQHMRNARLLCEAPAAVLLHTAHAELTRVATPPEVLQFSAAARLAYVDLVEKARWFSPLREGLDAYFSAVQTRVNGHVRLRLFKGEYATMSAELIHAASDSSAALRLVPLSVQH